jgi:maleate isomerase
MAEREPFQGILEDLLESTGASRTTLRLDLPDQDAGLDVVAAEALAPGVRSIRDDTAIRNLRGTSTVRFLEEHRRVLVQNDCSADDLAPPPELIEHYGVRAQMLAPIVREGRLAGVISVHYVPGPREWSAEDVAALQQATERVQRELDAAVQVNREVDDGELEEPQDPDPEPHRHDGAAEA